MVPADSPVTSDDTKGHTHKLNKMSALTFAPGGTLSDSRREKRRDQCI